MNQINIDILYIWDIVPLVMCLALPGLSSSILNVFDSNIFQQANKISIWQEFSWEAEIKWCKEITRHFIG